jgi:hypothetical protein
VGITLLPFLFGKIAFFTGYEFLLGILGLFLILIFSMTRQMNQKVAHSKTTKS